MHGLGLSSMVVKAFMKSGVTRLGLFLMKHCNERYKGVLYEQEI